MIDVHKIEKLSGKKNLLTDIHLYSMVAQFGGSCQARHFQKREEKREGDREGS